MLYVKIKKIKSFEKKIMVFSRIFLPFLPNIGLYIYTLKIQIWH